MRMAKKLKEDVNLDEIDENFIISSFKTTEPQQMGGTLQAVETGEGEPGNGKGKETGTVGVRRKVPETERAENTTVRVYQRADSCGHLPTGACDSGQGYNGGRLYRYGTGGTSGKAQGRD